MAAMAAKKIELLQEQLKDELEKFKAKEKECEKIIAMHGSLEAQLTENLTVQSEIELLKDDGEVFKLIGPVLMKVEKAEAKDNVLKRIDYIKAEVKRCEDQIASLSQAQNQRRQTLTNLQKNIQEAVQTGAA